MYRPGAAWQTIGTHIWTAVGVGQWGSDKWMLYTDGCGVDIGDGGLS